MPSSSWSQRLFAAFEASGIAIAQAHKNAIIEAADGLSDDFLNKAVDAIVANLPTGGVKSIEFDPIKTDLLSSEPQFDTALNDQIGKLFDLLGTVSKG